MVGGRVIEVCDIPGRSELWVNCVEYRSGRKHPDTCSVLVERNADSEAIQIGDKLWWQSGYCYWTTQDESRVEVKIRKVGGSGVTYATACRTGEKEQ